MNAKEFRVGNILREKNSGELIQVVELNEETVIFSGSFDGDWQAEPIRLTKNVLLNIGFEEYRKDHNWIEFKMAAYIYHFRTNDDCANNFGIIGSNNGIYYFNWNTVYLHQLQNLYFALTGQELETLKVDDPGI